MSSSALSPARGARPEPETGRGLLAYVLLAYGFSWAWLVVLGVTGQVVGQGEGWPTHFPALIGPLLAAVIVAARTGALRRLLLSMIRLRVSPRWWAWALSPLALLAVGLAAESISGQQLPAAGDFARMSGLSSTIGVAGVCALVFLVNGYGEETGWRGFALPRLQQRFPPLTAMLVLAVIWTGWHLPMFLVIDSFRDFSSATVVGWLLGLTAGSIVLGWLYNRSGESVALVAVWHACFNMVSATAAGTGLVAAVVTTAVMVQAIVLVAAELLARRGGRPSVLGPAIGTLTSTAPSPGTSGP